MNVSAFDNPEERLVEPQETQEDLRPDKSLRPKDLSQFIGQEHIKQTLTISMEAANKRSEPLDHSLLYGSPGLGKTTLANIIANEMNSAVRTTSGPALERVGDLAAILSNLQAGDVLFIDEIHRIPKTIEEVLYTAMEDFAIDIIVGKGPAARTLRMNLEPFTLIGATTRLNLLSSPLRDRFGHVFHFQLYNHTDIHSIVERSAQLLEVDIHPPAASLIAERCRRTPRIANRLLRRVRDYAQVKADGIINEEVAQEALTMLNVDPYGLDHIDRRLLEAIIQKFQGGPVGLSTLAAAIAEDIDTVESIYEPYLLHIGMLERTARGRKATQLAKRHLEK